MLIAVSSCVLYVACVGLFQASPKRTQLPFLRDSAPLRLSLRSACWVLLLGTLGGISAALGLERGIPVWLVLLSLAGIASLLVTALVPQRHLLSGGVLAGVATLLLLSEGVRSMGLLS